MDMSVCRVCPVCAYLCLCKFASAPTGAAITPAPCCWWRPRGSGTGRTPGSPARTASSEPIPNKPKQLRGAAAAEGMVAFVWVGSKACEGGCLVSGGHEARLRGLWGTSIVKKQTPGGSELLGLRGTWKQMPRGFETWGTTGMSDMGRRRDCSDPGTTTGAMTIGDAGDYRDFVLSQCHVYNMWALLHRPTPPSHCPPSHAKRRAGVEIGTSQWQLEPRDREKGALETVERK